MKKKKGYPVSEDIMLSYHLGFLDDSPSKAQDTWGLLSVVRLESSVFMLSDGSDIL